MNTVILRDKLKLKQTQTFYGKSQNRIQIVEERLFLIIEALFAVFTQV